VRGQRIEAENPKWAGKRVDGFEAKSLVARRAPCPQKITFHFLNSQGF